MAIQTPLGWTLVGPKSPKKSIGCTCGKICEGVVSIRAYIKNFHPRMDEDDLVRNCLSISPGASVGGESKPVLRASVSNEEDTRQEKCDSCGLAYSSRT